MEKVIYKYGISGGVDSILLPLKAEVLCVQSQHNAPFLWVLIDKNETEHEPRLFETFGTGTLILPNSNSDRKYIGTYQISDGLLVFHVFEAVPKI